MFIKIIDLTDVTTDFGYKSYSFSRHKNQKIIDFYAPADNNKLHYSISEREKEILLLSSKGKKNKEISKMLGISYRTVGVHKNNIFKKLKVNSIMEAVSVYKQNV